MYDPIMFVLPESIDRGQYVTCTYYAEGQTDDLLLRAGSIAIEQTTGTWIPVPRETPEVRRRSVGRVIAVHEIPAYEFELPEEKERRFVFQVAYPFANIGAQIPELLTTVMGNISMSGKIKLLDIEFPEVFTSGFQGPKFGIDGLRKLLDVPKRPLLLGMIKPCTGLSPQDLGELVYELGMGGIDIVKDDELLGDPSFCRVEDRLAKALAAVKEVYGETGKTVLYAVNVTDRPDLMRQKARQCVAAGANSLMVNAHTTGPAALQMLAEDPEINVPLLSHPAFAGTMFESPYSGLSSHLVLGKIQRLAGADIVVYPSSLGKVTILKEREIRISQALKSPLHHLKPVFPTPSAGMHPGLVPVLVANHGLDLVVGAGGGIHGHPQGATAGVRGMLQAIQAVTEGIPLEDAAREHEELAIGLKLWGTGGSGNNRLYELKR